MWNTSWHIVKFYLGTNYFSTNYDASHLQLHVDSTVK